ncbi:MAG: division/cell wall cluster transcriptional repressor MraZ [Spirochaetaceae bacterium]|nr:division/cell wall cluster transcriptional repressor MraZ [Spirochaetaceae bacterium]
MISGEYRNALDEKGRLMVPAKVRAEVVGNVMILTRGVDRCLWLFPSEEWRQLSENLIAATSPFSERARLIQRRILAPAQEVEIDRSGRIAIPSTLRGFAALKKDCTILGMVKYLEIWDEPTYTTYLEENEERFKEAAEEIGGTITF